MSLSIWFAFMGTILLFMSTPGPSHLLMFSTSLTNGFKRSLATAAGDLGANTLQIIAAGLGLAALIMASQYGFMIIKWCGVAYLVWIGVKMILRASDRQSSEALPKAGAKTLYFRGFITSASNPKAIVFFAALFPQFIDPSSALAPQVLILGLTYIIVDGLFLCAYGSGASWIAKRFASSNMKWLDRLAGLGFIGTAILLGLKTLPQN